MFGIYTKRLGSAVLLTDGAFTSEGACNKDEIAPLRPRLFATNGGASNYMAKHGYSPKYYTVKKYGGRQAD